MLRVGGFWRVGRFTGPGLVIVVTCLSLLLAVPVQGQRLAVGDADEAYARVLQLLGRAPSQSSMMIRPLSMGTALGLQADTVHHPWAGRWAASFHSGGGNSLFVHDPEARAIFIGDHPQSRNEGALTPGRAFTGAVTAGATLRSGPLSVSLRPMAGWVQNDAFDLAPVRVSGQPEFAYPWKRMDAPQRFGPDPYWLFDLGQSEVRLDHRGVSASFGTTNLWWGPGRQNAILMSNNAAGFPHASLETSHPIRTGIGTFEAQWIFGRLQSSDWFDESIEDRGRYLTGAAVTFSPLFWGLDGLSLGAARVFYARVPEEGIGIGEYFLVFQTPIKESLKTPDSPTGDDERDQLFSLFARWVFPESGFEVYGEWARNDHSERLIDYFLVLGNTQAITLGFQKATELPSGHLLVFNGEVTQLENPADTRVWFARPTYYAHGRVPRGYTQKGQVIGAAIGSGSNAQYLGAELYTEWGKASAYLQRLVFDRDAWTDYNVSHGGGGSPDVQGLIGGTVTLFRGPWDVEGGMEYSKRFNRYFVFKNDKENIRLSLTARLRLGWEKGR